MSVLQELRDAIAHVTSCTGDSDAWKRGLTPADLVAVSAAVIDPAAVSGLLAKVRANNPTLFDPRTGAPVVPHTPEPGPPPGQQGEAASAMKKAEDVLAQQNSATAQLDLHVIGAILNAHTQAVEGSDRLRRLQQEVEDAVRQRTDLDTPSGARDFQRFLISKLREIGAVVEAANLDDTSKAALANAWTALYNSAGSADAAGTEVSRPVAATPSTTRTVPAALAADPPRAPEALPPYGSDIRTDPLLDSLLTQGETVPAGSGSPASGVAPPMPIQSGVPPLPMASMTPPGLTAPPLPGGGPELFRPDPGFGMARAERPAEAGDAPLDRLLDEDFPLDERLGEPVDGAPADDEKPGENPPPPESCPAAESTTVRLPDGGFVNAPSPKIADVLRSAIAGTPIVDAFRQEGITVPPPGTAVPHPVDPARLVGGDVGMFTDRQVLAVDRNRALVDGRIQPVASVSGPSFLGWLHPQGQDTTTSKAPSSTPMQGATPPPTRPATAGAR